jgi:multidrug resistance efflux pump
VPKSSAGSGDKLTLLTAEFDVRRAGLEAAVDADLISANDHKIRLAELAEAERNLEKLKRDVAQRALTSKAALTVLEEKKNRSTMAASRAKMNMENLVLRAPTDGVVNVRENFDGMMYGFDGMAIPTLRIGDTVSSGRPVIDIYDLSSMDVRARVNETGTRERGHRTDGAHPGGFRPRPHADREGHRGGRHGPSRQPVRPAAAVRRDA